MKNRTLPYGYCCVDGKITVHGGEAVIVAEIYKEYLDGKSLLAIAEYLNNRQIEYMPSVIGWNKARLKRILEDERYIGNKQYPNLIDEETHNAVLSVKNTRNTQKDTDRQTDIYQLPVPVLCGECHGRMKRLYNKRRKCQTSWKCENCGKTIDKEDDKLLADMTVLVNTVITTPKIVKIPTATPVDPYASSITRSPECWTAPTSSERKFGRSCFKACPNDTGSWIMPPTQQDGWPWN